MERIGSYAVVRKTEQLLDAFTGVVDASHPPTLVVSRPTHLAPTEDGPGQVRELPSEETEFFHAEDDERAMVIDAHGVEIRLVGLNDISIDFPWNEIASIGHTLKDASLQCTLFIESTDRRSVRLHADRTRRRDVRQMGAAPAGRPESLLRLGVLFGQVGDAAGWGGVGRGGSCWLRA